MPLRVNILTTSRLGRGLLSVDRSYISEPLKLWKYCPRLSDLCTIESVSCEQESPHDSTSAVRGGSLCLTRSLKQVRVERGEYKPNGLNPLSYRFPGRIRGLVDKGSADFALDRPLTNDSGLQTAQGGKENPYLIFRLFSWISEGKRMGPETWFLVLVRSSRVNRAFERIGAGNVYGEFFEGASSVTIGIV